MSNLVGIIRLIFIRLKELSSSILIKSNHLGPVDDESILRDGIENFSNEHVAVWLDKRECALTSLFKSCACENISVISNLEKAPVNCSPTADIKIVERDRRVFDPF